MLRDSAQSFTDRNCRVLGASFDSPADNKAFKDAQAFSFPLLSDAGKQVGSQYQVVRAADHQYANFPERHSYLIDPDGTIAKVYDVTAIGDHAAAVLADLAELQQ